MNKRALSRVLELFEAKDKRCISHLLLQDNQGRTPIDIVIENDLVKSMEIMLLKLSSMPNFRVSKLLFDKFPFFFRKDNRAFYRYLDTCFF